MSSGVTKRNLEIFMAVCTCGGASAAARELGISQPSVSLAIRDLEEHFQTSLFDRVSRRLVPTERGRLLLRHAQAVLADFEALGLAMSEEGAVNLRVASSITTGTCYLPKIVSLLERRGTGVRVLVRVEDSEHVERDVVDNEVDVGLVEGIVRDRGVVCVPFAQDELVVVTGPSRPVETIGAEDLVRQRLILRERGSGVRDLLDSALRSRGLAASPIWESVSTEAIKGAVAEGIGISVLPLSLVGRELEEGTLIRVETRDLSMRRSLLAVRHREKVVSPAMEAFWQAALEVGRPTLERGAGGTPSTPQT